MPEVLMNGLSLLQEQNFQRVQNEWHHEEVKFREEELYRRQVEDARRTVTEQAEQLKVCLCFDIACDNCGLSSCVLFFAQ
jgi:hypothetical protein